MQKKESGEWPEDIISEGVQGITQSIRRQAKIGVLHKIASNSNNVPSLQRFSRTQ